MNPPPPYTQAEREQFWTEQGWTPDLPAAQREMIEAEFPDYAIREARALGF